MDNSKNSQTPNIKRQAKQWHKTRKSDFHDLKKSLKRLKERPKESELLLKRHLSKDEQQPGLYQLRDNEKFLTLFFTNFYLQKKYDEGYKLVTEFNYLSPINSSFVFHGNIMRFKALYLEKMFL